MVGLLSDALKESISDQTIENALIFVRRWRIGKYTGWWCCCGSSATVCWIFRTDTVRRSSFVIPSATFRRVSRRWWCIAVARYNGRTESRWLAVVAWTVLVEISWWWFCLGSRIGIVAGESRATVGKAWARRRTVCGSPIGIFRRRIAVGCATEAWTAATGPVGRPLSGTVAITIAAAPIEVVAAPVLPTAAKIAAAIVRIPRPTTAAAFACREEKKTQIRHKHNHWRAALAAQLFSFRMEFEPWDFYLPDRSYKRGLTTCKAEFKIN